MGYTRAEAARRGRASADARGRRQDAPLGRDHETTLASLNNLAVLYQAKERVDEALALDREVLALRRAAPWRRSSDVDPGSLNNVAFRLGTLRPVRRGASAAGGGAHARRADLGVDHPIYGTLVHSLGEIELSAGNLDAASSGSRPRSESIGSSQDINTSGSLLYQLAQVAVRRSQLDAAIDLLVRGR